MIRLIKRIFLSATILFVYSVGNAGEIKSENYGECTIGVFSGRITTDGRPLLWKNRDVGDPDQAY